MTQYVCILQCGELCDSTDTISIERWSKLKEKTKEWRGLDKFGCVYETTQWDQSEERIYIHTNCYLTLSSKRTLEQAKKRKKDRDSDEKPTSIPQDEREQEFQPSSPKPKRLRSSIGGPLHQQGKCVCVCNYCAPKSSGLVEPI